MPNLITRPYTPTDIPAILQLLATCFPEYWGKWVKAGRTDLAFNSHPIIACADGRLIGNCGILRTTVHLGTTVQTIGCIGSVAVHPDFRGQGVAGIMLQAAIRQMLSEKINLSALFTDKAQVYAKHGWRIHPLTPALTLQKPAPHNQPLPQINTYAGRPTPKLCDTIKLLYDQGAPVFSGKLQRSTDYWQNRIFNCCDPDTLWLVLADASGPVAYALVSHGVLCETYSLGDTIWPAVLTAARHCSTVTPLLLSLPFTHPLRQLALAPAASTLSTAPDVYGEVLMLNPLTPDTIIPDTLFWPKMDKF